MEWNKSIQVFSLLFGMILLILSQTSAFPAPSSSLGSYSPEDYDQQPQGLREILEELERQGGLTGQMVQRGYPSYYSFPDHKMARKSPRSNTLRLRFGKRSIISENEDKNAMDGENPISWKERPDTKLN